MFETFAEVRITAMSGQPRHPSFGIEDITLHLGQGDRRLGQLPVNPADRICGVLPALVAKPRLGPSLVFDEAVAVAVAPLVDPVQRRERVWPVALDQRVV